MSQRLRVLRACAAAWIALMALVVPRAVAQEALPTLTEPVNDFAKVIDPESRARLEDLIRRVHAATGDTIIVATRPALAPFADERELAVRWFENNGRGIGDQDKDTGVLLLLVPEDRAVWIEVGYGLEGPITDGFAGNLSREVMRPFFAEGRYGEGLVAGATRLAQRIAQERNITIEDLPPAPRAASPQRGGGLPWWFFLLLFALFLWLSSRSRGGGDGDGGPSQRYRGGRRGSTWGHGWSGWGTGGVIGGMGGFGGGSFGGGSFGGGGFGGFGGGASGGGGGGARW